MDGFLGPIMLIGDKSGNDRDDIGLFDQNPILSYWAVKSKICSFDLD